MMKALRWAGLLLAVSVAFAAGAYWQWTERTSTPDPQHLQDQAVPRPNAPPEGHVITANILFELLPCPESLRSIEVRAPSDGLTKRLLGVAESGSLDPYEGGCEANVTIPVLDDPFYLVTILSQGIEWGPYSKQELEGNDWTLALTVSASDVGD